MSKSLKGFEGFVKINIPLIFLESRNYFLIEGLQFFEEVKPNYDPRDSGYLIEPSSPASPGLDLSNDPCFLVFVEDDCRVRGDDISDMF